VKKTWLAALLALTSVIYGATTNTWDTSSTNEFLKGRLRGLSVSSEGWLRPGPAIAGQTPLNEPVLWSLIPAGQGGVYASTGHSGKVYHVDRAGKATLIWRADQPEVFALCTDSKGRLYAGTSPEGGVYRIDEGKAVEIAHLGTKYIWALAAGSDDSIFVATGDQGRVYRIDSSGKAEVYFETGQSNVTSLALGFTGHLYAGTEPNGLLYDISGTRHGVVVFRSNLPEIHAIAVAQNGTIFASGIGGSLTSRISGSSGTSATSSTPVVATTPTVISVSEAKQNTGATPEQSADVKVQSPKGTATSTVTAAAPAAPAYVEVSGVEKSAIYRIQPDGPVDTLRTSKEENVFDLSLRGDTVDFSTDVRGRLYALLPDRQQTLLTETGDGDANRVIRTEAGLWMGLSNPARVVFIANSTATNASYESPVHDTGSLARWGRLTWNATASGLTFQTRTGNSSRPDSTWSSWSEPIRSQEQSLITSPRGRYIQWRAEWPKESTAELRTVTVPFLAQNSAPIIRSISVSSTNSGAQTGKSSANTSSSQSAYTVTVTDTGDASASTSGTTTQTATRQSGTQTQITWQADDPDNDKLVYSVFFRGETEREWKLLRKDVYDNTLQLDSDSLADGRYLFKVVGSDRPANDLRYAQQAELVSSPVLIDSTPPAVITSEPQRTGDGWKVTFAGEDQISALKRCEYSIDAGPWQPLEAADGITDSKRENFELLLGDLKPGEHVVTIRLYDTAGNAGLAKVLLH
jgi:hypothetical protein